MLFDVAPAITKFLVDPDVITTGVASSSAEKVSKQLARNWRRRIRRRILWYRFDGDACADVSSTGSKGSW